MPPLARRVEVPAITRWRQRLLAAGGAERWRLLGEFAGSAECAALLQAEHPALATALAMNRRDFFRYGAAALALAGLTGCGHPPPEEIVPMRVQDEAPPGAAPRFYATTLPFDGYGSGVLVESHEGRPTKVEGNPRHPASLGATDIHAQAAVLELWDPDRSQALRRQGLIGTWEQFLAELQDRRRELEPGRGAGLHILSGAVGSPTLQAQLAALLQRYPQARHHSWQAWSRDNVHRGAELAFGAALEPLYRLDRAQVILALDADFLGAMPGRVRYARDFIDGRRLRGSPGRMNRLYAVEPTFSLTGGMADHRLAAGMADIAAMARQLGAAFGLGAADDRLPAQQRRWLEAVVADLRQHRGAALVIAGEAQPPQVHALAHALNAALDAPGRTVEYVEPVAPAAGSILELGEAMRRGEVRLLLMLGVNPVADAPADLEFAAALARVPCSIHLGLYADETAQHSTWHIPEAHPLEAWSDLRAHDGTASIVQPLLRPLYGGRSAHELLAAFAGQGEASGYELVRNTWRPGHGRDFEAYWKACLQDGVIAGSAAAPHHPSLRGEAVAAALQAQPGAASGLELVIRPDPTIWDGRYANNGWLQELPKPASQLTWDNAVVIGPALAAQHRLREGDEVLLRLEGREVRGPVWISAAQAERSVTVFLGYGRSAAGRIGNGLGYDANRLRGKDAPWVEQGLELRPTGRHRELPTTQQHFRMEGREPVRTATLERFNADPQVARRPEEDGPFPSLYPERPPGPHAWALHVDLNACIGCKVCTIACQAENNIPVVGAEQVQRGRAMHWIRVDHYDDEAALRPHGLHQPVPCMHCEHAPCELVCPVGATTHDSDGLNLQVYNRCIGTRFCSNNCPYKVRRFNFLQYSDTRTGSLEAQRNPQVTVRNRGVMEKCTYCVQRIRAVELSAEKEGRPIRDGEVKTACQAACPTQAITFGDLREAGSAVNAARGSPLHYALLAELNTRPRTTYSARLRNPNPALEGKEGPA